MRVVERRSFASRGILYLARLSGDRFIEFVDAPQSGSAKGRKRVLMISTQAGCVVGCRMCDGSAIAWRGNLSADEIVAQVRRAAGGARLKDGIEVHLTRLGEPTLNPDTPRALELLARERPGLAVAVSTVAPDSRPAERCLEEMLAVKDRLYGGGRFRLQFSAHSTDEAARRLVMRSRPWRLERVAEFGRRWWRPGDLKVALNFALAPDQPLDPDAVARLFDPGRFLVKITPVAPTHAARASASARPWTRAPRDVAAADEALRARGFEVQLVPGAAAEVRASATCGQLWSGVLRDEARAGLRADRLERELGDRPGGSAEASRPSLGEPPRPDGAGLLVVDLIERFAGRNSPDYFPRSRAAVVGAVRLLDAFRSAGRPVFFSIQRGPVRRSRDLSRPPAGTAPRSGEALISGKISSARLRRVLNAAGVRDLVVCGVETDRSVASAARAVRALGLRAFAALDATAARSDEAHFGALRRLSREGVRVVPVEGLISSVSGRCVAKGCV